MTNLTLNSPVLSVLQCDQYHNSSSSAESSLFRFLSSKERGSLFIKSPPSTLQQHNHNHNHNDRQRATATATVIIEQLSHYPYPLEPTTTGECGAIALANPRRRQLRRALNRNTALKLKPVASPQHYKSNEMNARKKHVRFEPGCILASRLIQEMVDCGEPMFEGDPDTDEDEDEDESEGYNKITNEEHVSFSSTSSGFSRPYVETIFSTDHETKAENENENGLNIPGEDECENNKQKNDKRDEDDEDDVEKEWETLKVAQLNKIRNQFLVLSMTAESLSLPLDSGPELPVIIHHIHSTTDFIQHGLNFTGMPPQSSDLSPNGTIARPSGIEERGHLSHVQSRSFKNSKDSKHSKNSKTTSRSADTGLKRSFSLSLHGSGTEPTEAGGVLLKKRCLRVGRKRSRSSISTVGGGATIGASLVVKATL